MIYEDEGGGGSSFTPSSLTRLIASREGFPLIPCARVCFLISFCSSSTLYPWFSSLSLAISKSRPWAGDRRKTGEPFRTFFSAEATQFLRKYVETERSDTVDGDPLFALDERTYDRRNPRTKEPEKINFN